MISTHRSTFRRSFATAGLAAAMALGMLAAPVAQASASATTAPTFRVVVPAPVTVGSVSTTPVRTAATAAPASTAARPASTTTARSAGQVAVDRARAQLGKRYQWGGTGPNGFDCSGLTQTAWRAAGVTIPRVSRDQAARLPSVSRADLQPGDLVFFNRPVNHVGIYAGNGELIEASSGRGQVVARPLAGRTGIVGYGRPS